MKPASLDNRKGNTLAWACLDRLTEAHVRHIFETFHEGWDYEGRLDAVLRCFRRWAGR